LSFDTQTKSPARLASGLFAGTSGWALTVWACHQALGSSESLLEIGIPVEHCNNARLVICVGRASLQVRNLPEQPEGGSRVSGGLTKQLTLYWRSSSGMTGLGPVWRGARYPSRAFLVWIPMTWRWSAFATLECHAGPYPLRAAWLANDVHRPSVVTIARHRHMKHGCLPRSPHPAHGGLHIDGRAGRPRRAVAGFALRPVTSVEMLG
jgi:hypothetical protein